MRNPSKKSIHSEDVKSDPSKVTLLVKDERDCFAKECSPKDSNCAKCADMELCLVMMDFTVNTLEAEKEEEELFLDQQDFSLVSKQEMFDYIKRFNPDKERMIAWVAKAARSKDDIAVVNFIQEFRQEYKGKVVLKGGIFKLADQ